MVWFELVDLVGFGFLILRGVCGVWLLGVGGVCLVCVGFSYYKAWWFSVICWLVYFGVTLGCLFGCVFV